IPLPKAIRIAEPHAETVIGVWWRDSKGNILFDGRVALSASLSLGPTRISSDKNDWLTDLRALTITAEQIDEFTCRIDELSAEQALALANIRQPVMTDTKRGEVSVALGKVIEQDLGLVP